MGSTAAFQSGLQTERTRQDERRQHKQALEDESRQFKVADLWDQRNAIRANLASLGLTDPNNPAVANDPRFQQGQKSLTDIQTQLDDIHDPVKNPGALQRDFEFIKGLITRKHPAQAPPTSSAPPSTTSTIPDVTLGSSAAPLAPSIEPISTASTAPPTPVPLAQRGKTPPEPPPPAPVNIPSGPVTIPGRTTKVAGPTLPASDTMAIPTPKITGLIAPGNIPIWNRPAVQNADGTHSSEFSTSFTDENPKSPYYGKEVLAPTIVKGKFLTPDGKKPPEGSPAEKAMLEAARAHYEQTGEQLGVFDSPASADRYADDLHKRGEKKRPSATSYTTPQQRKAQAQQEKSEKEAQQFMQAAPLSPQQEAQAQVEAQIAKINIVDKLPGLTDEQKQEAKSSLLYTALGIPRTPKYFSQLQTTTDAAGKVHVYRVPQDPTMPPEEIKFGEGETFAPKTTGSRANQGLAFDKATGQVVDKSSTPQKRYSESDANLPPDVKAMFAGYHNMDAIQKAYMLRLTAERGASYNASRPMQVLDTQNNNAPTTVTFTQMMEQPGRYLPASGAKFLAQENLIEDIGRTSRATREAINGLTEDFPEDMKAKIAVALTAEDHGSALNALLASSALANLTTDQFQFLVAARQLTENAMAMRSILGTGQSSDSVRAAIQATLPSLLSPDKQKALTQLDAFDKTLEQLSKGIPKVPLRQSGYSVQGGGDDAAGKGGRSISKVKTWMQGQPQWKGQTVTDQMASDYIRSLHYTPTP